jgi:hypothetical protein
MTEDMRNYQPKAGVWVVYCYDVCAVLLSVHETELEALREAVKDQNHVVFLPYGKQFREVLT